MQNTLQTHMKTPKIQDFPQNYTVWAFYMQNTPKTLDNRCDFFQKIGKFAKYCAQLITNLTIIVVENSEKSGFSTNSKQIFAKYLLFYMWFYKGIKVNILATTQKTTVALIYKINPVQITTIIAENTENLLNSVPNTNRKYPIQNCEKLSNSKIVRNSHLL